MQAPPRARILQPGEVPLRQEGRHALSVVDDILIVLMVLAGAGWALFAFLAPQGLRAEATLGSWALAAAAIIYVVIRFLRVATSRYVITDERIYASHGRLREHLVMTTYDKVTDLHVHQSLLGRWFGFGTVRAHTAGARVALAGIRDPFAIKSTLEEARVRFVQRLIGEHKAKKATVRARAAPAEMTAAPSFVWKGRPKPESTLGSFITGGGLLTAALGSMVVAAGRPPMFLLVPAFFGLFGLLTLFATWVRLRYTQYEITDKGLVVTTGWLGRQRVETRYEKITDVTTSQSLLGRLLDYGTIVANTAGSVVAPIQFQGVADPLKLKDLIERTRAARVGETLA